MKIKHVFLTLAACCAVGVSAQQLNVFASDLKAEKVTGNEFTVTYTLNAPATEVLLNVGGKSFSLGEGMRGVNETNVVIDGVTGVNMPWSITATGEPSSDPAYVGKKTFTQSRSVAVDNNLNSPFFGRIYVTDTKSGGSGVMVFNAALEDITEQGDVPYGGNAGFTTGAASPQRVHVAEDALYLCDWSDAHPGVWKADPANLTADFVPIFGGTPNSAGLRSKDGVDIAGSIVSCWVKGSGENSVLYTFDEDYGKKLVLLQYNIGTAENPWEEAPSAVIFDNHEGHEINGNTNIVPDATGWWITQYRYSETVAYPGLIHITEQGVIDFSSTSGETPLIGNSQNGGLAISNDGKLLAVASSDRIKVFDLASPVEGTRAAGPTLTPKYEIPTQQNNTRLCSLAFDPANNIYVATDQGFGIRYFSTPTDNNSFTTPALGTISIESFTAVEGVNADKQVAGVSYVNVAGQVSKTPWNGINVVVTTYTDGSKSVVKTNE